jgi:hypothetical protein
LATRDCCFRLLLLVLPAALSATARTSIRHRLLTCLRTCFTNYVIMKACLVLTVMLMLSLLSPW